MSFDEMMKELRIEYLHSLPSKIHELEQSCAQNDVDSLLEDFHKLKGTGKTYGFDAVSELSAVVERVLNRQPQVCSQVVPEAIDILRDIHREHSASRSFDLASDSRFNEIRALAA